MVGGPGLLGSAVVPAPARAAAARSATTGCRGTTRTRPSRRCCAAAEQLPDGGWRGRTGAPVPASSAAARRSSTPRSRVLEGFLDRLGAPAHPAGHGFFLASSAGGVYAGSADPPFTEHTEPAPISPYGQAKLRVGGGRRRAFAARTGDAAAGRTARQPLRPGPEPRQAAGAGLAAVPGPAHPPAAERLRPAGHACATTSSSTTRQPWWSPALDAVTDSRQASTEGARQRALDHGRRGARRPAPGHPASAAGRAGRLAELRPTRCTTCACARWPGRGRPALARTPYGFGDRGHASRR